MNDDTYDDIAKQLESQEGENPQPAEGSVSPENAGPAEQPKQQTTQNYAFFTPTEAGIRATDPNDIPAAPRPQPGMTFTPTGGSVSNVHHQLNSESNNNVPELVEPENTAQQQ